MEAFDTNVIVRLLVRDNEEQARRAEACFGAAIARAGAWLSTVVLVEVSWVLQRAYKLERAQVASSLRNLITTAGVRVENEELALMALTAFETGAADFADYMILEAARLGLALPLHTFDERLARSAGTALV